jgi:uncharacterized protein (TIGR02271 family)
VLLLRQARDLPGKTMIDATGSKVGTIDSIYMDPESETLTFATVTTGLFGTGTSFVPLAAADLRDDRVVVPFTKDVVKDAPEVPADRDLNAREEAALYAHYRELMTTAPPTDVDGSDAMTLSEERMRVGTEKVETGRVRLKKVVATESETVDVPVAKERVVLEREPIPDGAPVGDARLEEDAQEVVLREERPVVAKEAVPVERVRLGKETRVDQVQVSDEVRKEQAELDEDR